MDSNMEKSPLIVRELPAPAAQSRRPKRNRVAPSMVIMFFLAILFFRGSLLFYFWETYHHSHPHHPSDVQYTSLCDQPDPLFPSTENDKLNDMYDYLSSEDFRDGSIKRHSGAVRIPTESFDDMGAVGEDSRWEIMYKFQSYLEKVFPRVHEHMNPEVVNTHGLLYTLEGSDEGLKPVLFLAHYDVVPVPNATVDAWTHPPFSGHYDGTFIWGRGASDCKNQLIAVLESMELFLEAGFKPQRSIVLSFGFDEEINGRHGARSLAAKLDDRYGKNGIAAIVDEGAQFQKAWGTTFAVTGTGEKGYTDVHITVRMPGGHSSVPSDHTSIGVLSELITRIEAEQYPVYLTDDNPYMGQLQCGAANSASFPKSLKKLLGERRSDTCRSSPDYLALEAAKEGGRIKYLMQTSQAVDIIEGGVKVNALPERTSVTVNHRVNIGDTTEHVWDHLTSLAKSISEKYNLTLHAFDGVKEELQSISLWPSPNTLDVAPVTPSNVDKNTPYRVVAGTVRAVYGEEIVVSPGMTTGNTDTRYYWGLTKHIFRFGPGYDPEFDSGELNNIHTVNEHISVTNHVNMVKWFTLFVRNMDEADLEG